MDTSHRVFALIASLLCAMAALAPHASGAAFGEPLWTNHYDGPKHQDDWNRNMAVDVNGNVVLTGLVDGNSSNPNIATVAFSKDGVPLWTNLYNGPNNGYDEGYAVATDRSGNVFVTGLESAGVEVENIVTLAYSSTGLPLWTNKYNGPANADDWGLAIATDIDGNVLVAGGSANTVPTGIYDCVTIKYSGGGVPLWTNRHSAPGNGDSLPFAITVDVSGNVFVSCDSATLAYSSAGVLLWTNLGSGALAVDGNGNVFVLRGASTVAYSGAGVPLWTNSYINATNNYVDVRGIALDANGSVFVTGNSWADYGNNHEMATLAYSRDGSPLWTNHFSGVWSRFGNGIAVDASGNVFVTSGSGGYVTIAYSGAGVPIWTNSFGIGADEFTHNNGIAVDGSGNIFVTGMIGNGSYLDYAAVKYAGVNSTPPAIGPNAMDSGQFQFLLSVDPNRAYTVEFLEALEVGNWLTLTSIAAQPTATTFIVTNAITNAARFYRVRTP